MGALPKNKITRAERGKRRKGNTPKIKVQHPNHVLMPLAKQTLFSRFLKLVNIAQPASAASENNPAESANSKKATASSEAKTQKKTVNRRAAVGTAPQQQSRSVAKRAMSAARTTPQSSAKKTSAGTKKK